MFGSGRSSCYGYDHGDMNEDGLSQAITPFVGGAMQGGLGSGGPISLFGFARRVGHRDDPSEHSLPTTTTTTKFVNFGLFLCVAIL